MADAYAKDAQDLSLAALKDRPLDAEPHLPLALGASIEVQAFVMERRDRRGDAVYFLNSALEKYRRHVDPDAHSEEHQPAHARRQAGAGAAGAGISRHQGAQHRRSQREARRPVLLGALVPRLQDGGADPRQAAAAYRRSGVDDSGADTTVRLGAARPESDDRGRERVYRRVRDKHYAGVDMAVPISEEDFKAYGASTTPTIVLVDRKGSYASIIRPDDGRRARTEGKEIL